MRLDFKRFQYVQGDFKAAVTWRPLLPFYLVNGEKRSEVIEGIVDSGAPMCVFPAHVGESVGIEIERGINGKLNGESARPTSDLYFHQVRYEVRDPGVALYAIETWVGFSYAQKTPLLGINGFFDRFKVTFNHGTQPPHFEIERIER